MAWTAGVLIALVLLQQVGVVPGHGRVAAGLQNALHGPWFAAVTWLIHRLCSRRLASSRALIVTAVAALVFALGTEAAQFGGPRQPEWLDVGFDLLGAAAALTVLCGRAFALRRSRVWTPALLLMFIATSPFWVAAAIQMHRDAIFPRLVDIAAPWQGGLLEREADVRIVERPPQWHDVPARVLEVRLTDTEWPGIHLPEPVPDWRGFDALEVDVFVIEGAEALPLSVSIRLRGAPTDHVYRTISLTPGAHRLHLRLRELFDPECAEVTRVVVYSTRSHAGRVFLLGDVRLVAAPPAMVTRKPHRYAGIPGPG